MGKPVVGGIQPLYGCLGNGLIMKLIDIENVRLRVNGLAIVLTSLI